ncbi:MAG: PepSY domain-containing protein [Phenylobacterium sp.]|uniref:PepSY domain-containing protein n=1 Tax=Phenylobacterium sp. TaxID=1871053 RepID=UPI00391C8F19
MKRIIAIAALALAVPAAAQAQPWGDPGQPSYGAGRGDQDAARAAVRGGRQVPLSQVIATISARTPGRHLNTTMGDFQGRPAYFVQWQTNDGRVIIFIVDAQSGGILSRQGG